MGFCPLIWDCHSDRFLKQAPSHLPSRITLEQNGLDEIEMRQGQSRLDESEMTLERNELDEPEMTLEQPICLAESHLSRAGDKFVDSFGETGQVGQLRTFRNHGLFKKEPTVNLNSRINRILLEDRF